MSDLVSEIEEIARRVYRQERERERGPIAGVPREPAADAETQERINRYLVVAHKPYLTRREAALYLDVSERSIAEWASRPPDQNPFPESHAGGEPRAKRERVDEWAAHESERRRQRAAG